MTSLRRKMIEDVQIRNLAANTQKSYVKHVSRFARHFQKSPELLGPEQIRAYQIYLTNEQKLATSSVTVAIAALRFLYRVMTNISSGGMNFKKVRGKAGIRPFNTFEKE